MTVSDDSKFEEAIQKHLSRFDIAALISALYFLDYRDVDIEFASNLTTLHHGALVKSVEFHKKPRRHVVVTVNIGLLSTQNPLPSYFRWVIERQSSDALAIFLNFFAHRLLQAEFLGQYPERDRSIFADFGRTRRDLLALLGLRTPSTLHWLFSHAFPELEVAVRRGTQLRAIPTKSVQLNGTQFGDGSAFGAVAKVPVPAIYVTLFCDEPTSGTGQPWAREAERRLRQWVFPQVVDIGLFLNVLLIFRDQPAWIILQKDSFLGHQPIYSEAQRTAPRQVRKVVLFDNEVTKDTIQHIGNK